MFYLPANKFLLEQFSIDWRKYRKVITVKARFGGGKSKKATKSVVLVVFRTRMQLEGARRTIMTENSRFWLKYCLEVHYSVDWK